MLPRFHFGFSCACDFAPLWSLIIVQLFLGQSCESLAESPSARQRTQPPRNKYICLGTREFRCSNGVLSCTCDMQMYISFIVSGSERTFTFRVSLNTLPTLATLVPDRICVCTYFVKLSYLNLKKPLFYSTINCYVTYYMLTFLSYLLASGSDDSLSSLAFLFPSTLSQGQVASQCTASLQSQKIVREFCHR